VVVIALFVGLHLGIGLNMELGNFAPACIASWMALLPPWFWDRLRRWSLLRWPAPAREALALPPLSGIETTLVLFCLAYALFLNIRGVALKDPSVREAPPPHFHDRTIHLGQTLGLDQGWGVFAPKPGDYYGWFILRARLEDGSLVDLSREGQPITLDKPPLIAETYINSRWRRYLHNLGSDHNLGHRQLYAAYLEREWNRRHPDRKVQDLTLVFMRQDPYGILRLMSPLNDRGGIPPEGRNLTVVVAVNDVLHFRIFDAAGKMVVDSDETRLPEKAAQIEKLRNQLQTLWFPHRVSFTEKGPVVTEIRSLVGYTPPDGSEEIIPSIMSLKAAETLDISPDWITR
jgi:hypothetical protein